jgi:P-type Ca2+ transporter type 2C
VAAARLKNDVFNELPAARPRTIWATAFEILCEPMLLLLVVTGLLYVVLGDPREAIALLATIFVVIGITLYQEHKAERALEALRDLSSPVRSESAMVWNVVSAAERFACDSGSIGGR